MKTMMLALVAMVWLVACGGSSERTFAEPCTNGVATHDFGPNPVGVSAYGTGPGCTSSVFPGPNGSVGYAQFQVPVTMNGSVATVSCSPGCGSGTVVAQDFTEVIFVEED
jgi:hypothetical protein